MKARKVYRVIGAYDSIRLYRYLERMGIEPVIRPRRNARTDRGPESKRSSTRMIRDLRYGIWVGYVLQFS